MFGPLWKDLIVLWWRADRFHLNLVPTIISCIRYYGPLRLESKPTANLENTMSKKAEKATLTTAMIEEQTAAFLKSGGAVEFVVKGRSGQFAPSGSKQVNLKAR